MALLAAFRDLLQTIEKAGKQPSSYTVDVWGDSSLVIKQLKGEWKVKDPKMQPLYDEISKMARQFKATRFNWHDRSNSVRLLGH